MPTDAPVVGDKIVGTLEITGDPSRDFKHAVEHHHPCDDTAGCDIARAIEDGYSIWAANLLLSATECPLVDAVLSYYIGGGYDFSAEAERERVEWLATSTWTAHAFRCAACNSISFGDDYWTPENCASCGSREIERTRVIELREEIAEAHRLGRDPQRQLCELYDLTDTEGGPMIHINVKRASNELRSYIVETSTDGGGWAEQYFCGPFSEAGQTARENAEHVARIFANGCRYAGAEVKMTSCGEELLRV